MKKIILLITVLLTPLFCKSQTKFSRSIDTVFVSEGDSMTVLNRNENVLSVGDTVSANAWYVSDDSVRWHILSDFNGNDVIGDSVMIDTLPAHKFYCAALSPEFYTKNIVWKVNNTIYKSLEKPTVTNIFGIDKADILLLRYDSISFYTFFDGLQPDTVVWKMYDSCDPDLISTKMPAYSRGTYKAIGYIFNPIGEIIDSSESNGVFVDFKYPLEKIILKSWAGSNDGKPRRIDTLLIDTCVREYVIDTLLFAIGDAYKYQFVPVVHHFDKAYDFSYKWEYGGFATVETIDSVLQFNPVDFKHSGNYVFTASLRDGMTTTNYRSAPVKITAYNTGNVAITNNYIEDGNIYSITGAMVKAGVSGYYPDLLRSLQLARGIYVLRAGNKTYKFIH